MINIQALMKTNNIEAMSYTTVIKGVTETVQSTSSSNRRFSACSISKLMTTIAVLQAKDEGLLDLHRDVNSYLSTWQLEGAVVTVEMLLINQSGIEDCEGSYGTFSLEDGRPNIVKLLNGETNYINKKVQVKHTPSTEFIYADDNFLILELLLSEIYKMSYRDIIESKIFKPLGMTSSGYTDYNDLNEGKHVYGTDKLGQHIGDEKNIYPYDSVAGLWSTSSDLSIVMHELLKSYHGKSSKLLHTSTTKEMLSPHGCVDFMGYGVFVYEIDGKKVFKSQGWGEGFQSYVLAFIEEETGIVVMMNQNPGVDQMDGPIGDVVESFIKDEL